jgi:hypothetical protein
MRSQKRKVKQAIELLKQQGVVLSNDEVERAMNGKPEIGREAHEEFENHCQESWSSGEPFVVNFNLKSKHPVFHRYEAYKNLVNHMANVRKLRKSIRRRGRKKKEEAVIQG